MKTEEKGTKDEKGREERCVISDDDDDDDDAMTMSKRKVPFARKNNTYPCVCCGEVPANVCKTGHQKSCTFTSFMPATPFRADGRDRPVDSVRACTVRVTTVQYCRC